MTSPTYAEAGAKAGVASETVRRYLRDPDFLAAYKARQEKLLDLATEQGKRSLSLALSTLWEVCGSESEAGQTRVAAARALLEYTIKLVETNDLDQRVAALEAREAESEGLAY